MTGEPSPPRRPRSIRRTSTVDITCDDAGATLMLHGSARDLATDADRQVRVLSEAQFRASVDVASGKLTEIRVVPDQQGRTAPLVGLTARSGFRGALRHELPDVATSGSLLGLLLDEIPVAVVIAGSLLRRRASGTVRVARASSPVDVCAGWARGGFLAATEARTGSPPLSRGPKLEPLTSSRDPHAWHELAPLRAWSMRRARRIDVEFPAVAGGDFEIDSMFRDSRVTGDGVERGVHAYSVRATVDTDGKVIAVDAAPGVLPAPECPAAAASAGRLIGYELGALRKHVATSFTGTSTCTHLNDALRALGDVDALIGVRLSDDRRVRYG